MDGRARLVEQAKPYLKHVPAGIYRDMMEQRLAELSQTNQQSLNKHLERPKTKPTKKTASGTTTANMTPVRYAITMLIQYPQLAAKLVNDTDFRPLQTPGINLLVELLETLRENPNLTTAGVLERYRETPHGVHLQKLAIQPLTLSAEELIHELQGIVDSLNKQLKEQRIQYLTSKPFSELTEAEKVEVKSFK
jgi:DNA primase